MESKKALVPPFFLIILFLVVGLKTMAKYWTTPGDWHFILASIGEAGFLLLFMVIVSRFLKSSVKNKALK